MNKAAVWFANNLSLGGIVGNVGKVTGKAINGAALVTAATSKVVIRSEETSAKVSDAIKGVGSITSNSLEKGSAKLGSGVNWCVSKISRRTGSICGSIFKAGGASDENVMVAEKVGTLLGAVAIGTIAGGCIADAAIAYSAAAGTAGGAATTSGLAALGGGSLASGGGGMVAGQAVVDAMVAAGGVSGASAVATTAELKPDLAATASESS